MPKPFKWNTLYQFRKLSLNQMTENEVVEHETESKVFETLGSCSGVVHDNGSKLSPSGLQDQNGRHSYISTANIMKVLPGGAQEVQTQVVVSLLIYL